MDPDQALAGIRATITSIREQRELYGGKTDGTCEKLCSQVEALDEWLTSGGFLPAEWSAAWAADVTGTYAGRHARDTH